jgi:hypothetical protein
MTAIITDDVEPLHPQQQLFLQRILASHIVTDKEAQTIFENILQNDPTQHNGLGRDVKDVLSQINRSLKPAFRLEIKSVALALPLPATNDNDVEEEEETTDRAGNRNKSVLYHSIVNCDSDAVSKSAANPTFTKSPHELAFFRHLLERLVEKDEDDEQSNNNRAKGCLSYLSRMDMINARLELTGAHKDKISIVQAEKMLDLLETQGWLVGSSGLTQDGGEENDDSLTSPDASSRRKRRRHTKGGGSGFDGSKYVQIGPRSYLEFSDFLIKVGMGNEKLPQFLLHG